MFKDIAADRASRITKAKESGRIYFELENMIQFIDSAIQQSHQIKDMPSDLREFWGIIDEELKNALNKASKFLDKLEKDYKELVNSHGGKPIDRGSNYRFRVAMSDFYGIAQDFAQTFEVIGREIRPKFAEYKNTIEGDIKQRQYHCACQITFRPMQHLVDTFRDVMPQPVNPQIPINPRAL